MTTELLDIFKAQNGIVCCVGAGGKKTTMFTLAAQHPGRVGITATAHIEYFPKTLHATKYIAAQDELLQITKDDFESKCIAFAQPSERRGRRAGIDPDKVERFKKSGNFDLLLIKADGARSRFVKAPAEHEPPLPACVNTVIPVISARAIGKPLTDKIAHRIERISAIAGVYENEIIKPIHIARLLASEEGSLKNTASANVVPLINMVDNSDLEKLAREVAQTALAMTQRFDYVVLAAMKKENPIINVIRRSNSSR